MDRLTELRRYVSTAERGIEIGPYHCPIAPRALGYNTINVDIFDARELRRRAEKDNNIPRENLARIEEVDVIGSADQLQELIEAPFGREQFDYLSSHNLEHLPDPPRFLQACCQLLAVGGHLSMAIPDKRCCYDFYRPLTDVSEWLQAYHEKRTCPTPAQVFLHCFPFPRHVRSVRLDQHSGRAPPSPRRCKHWKKLLRSGNGEFSNPRDSHTKTVIAGHSPPPALNSSSEICSTWAL